MVPSCRKRSVARLCAAYRQAVTADCGCPRKVRACFATTVPPGSAMATWRGLPTELPGVQLLRFRGSALARVWQRQGRHGRRQPRHVLCCGRSLAEDRLGQGHQRRAQHAGGRGAGLGAPAQWHLVATEIRRSWRVRGIDRYRRSPQRRYLAQRGTRARRTSRPPQSTRRFRRQRPRSPSSCSTAAMAIRRRATRSPACCRRLRRRAMNASGSRATAGSHGSIRRAFAAMCARRPSSSKHWSAGDARYEPAPGLSLAQGTRNLQVDYTALGYAHPDRLRFRYRLEGVDDTWVDAGPRRQAFIPTLAREPIGSRSMPRMKTACGATRRPRLNSRYHPRSFSRRRSLRFASWRRRPDVLLYRMRVRQLTARERSRHEERLRERERIARELHDTLLQSVQGLHPEVSCRDPQQCAGGSRTREPRARPAKRRGRDDRRARTYTGASLTHGTGWRSGEVARGRRCRRGRRSVPGRR